MDYYGLRGNGAKMMDALFGPLAGQERRKPLRDGQESTGGDFGKIGCGLRKG